MTDQEMDQYFIDIEKDVKLAYDIANKARKKGFDPEDAVPIPLAQNMAERVEGLISAISPQILNKGIPKRISELEKEYGAQDWRVAFKIAEELALEKFCKFSSKKEAMEKKKEESKKSEVKTETKPVEKKEAKPEETKVEE